MVYEPTEATLSRELEDVCDIRMAEVRPSHLVVLSGALSQDWNDPPDLVGHGLDLQETAIATNLVLGDDPTAFLYYLPDCSWHTLFIVEGAELCFLSIAVSTVASIKELAVLPTPRRFAMGIAVNLLSSE